MPAVTIIMGSLSDKAIGDKCTAVLNKLGISLSLRVASAHRTPDEVVSIVKESDSDVFIGIAGLAAALPGVIAAHTTKPVIGVPVGVKLDGLDALLSIMQMPPGAPVACMGVDRGENAALLAAEILALKDPGINVRLNAYREDMKNKVENDDAGLVRGD